jgi:hypothetical protein
VQYDAANKSSGNQVDQMHSLAAVFLRAERFWTTVLLNAPSRPVGGKTIARSSRLLHRHA